MGRLLVLLCVTAIAAQADPNDLTGGVFILHSPPEINWSCYEQYGACDGYDACGFGIQNCEEQNPRIDGPQTTIWYVIAAWSEAKTWCGVEFGLGSYPAEELFITTWGPCFPQTGLEIPTPGFPAPNTGTSIVVIPQPWEGNFQPVYWFIGYDGYGTPGQFPLTVHPVSRFGGFANCAVPSVLFPAECFGSLGIFEPGVTCCPGSVTPRVCCLGENCLLLDSEYLCTELEGIWHPEWVSCYDDPCAWDVCCRGEDCFFVSETDCAALGGVWHPEQEDCDPNPCLLPLGICCHMGQCYVMNEHDCATMEGDWHPEYQSCAGDPCLQFCHACCYGEICYLITEWECAHWGGEWHPEYPDCYPNPCTHPPDGHVCCIDEICYILTEEECAAEHGDWRPWLDDCSDPNACAPPVPAAPWTWGAIKAIYR
jgi:hypothetical protein